MSIANDATFQALFIASGAAFLIGCAVYNWRTGYRRVPRQESPLQEAFLWLAAVREALSTPDEPASPTTAPQTTASLPSEAEQLICLSSALGQSAGQVAPVTVVENSVPATAEKPVEHSGVLM